MSELYRALPPKKFNSYVEAKMAAWERYRVDIMNAKERRKAAIELAKKSFPEARAEWHAQNWEAADDLLTKLSELLTQLSENHLRQQLNNDAEPD